MYVLAVVNDRALCTFSITILCFKANLHLQDHSPKWRYPNKVGLKQSEPQDGQDTRWAPLPVSPIQHRNDSGRHPTAEKSSRYVQLVVTSSLACKGYGPHNKISHQPST